MEFWGTEIPPGKAQVNTPGEGTYLHVSQAALGPSKEGKLERVVIRVEAGGKNVVLGTLVSGKVDQMSLDLIFDGDFKLSHTSTSSSVFVCGYKTEKMAEDGFSSDEESQEDVDDTEDDDEDVPQAVLTQENGTPSAKEEAKVSKKVKAVEKAVEAKVKKVDRPKSDLIDNEASEGSSEEDDGDEEDGEGDELGDDSDELSDEEDDEEESDEDGSSDGEDEDEDEEEDVLATPGTKRALVSPSPKPAVGGKKARLDTPAKPGLITAPGKKAKGAGAAAAAAAETTPVTGGKKSEKKEAVPKTPQKTPQQKPGKDATPKTPKSVTPGGDSAKKLGAYHCAECKRNFATESGLSQHSAAKHKS